MERRKNILSWNPEDRPREKLLGQGRRALTDAELIAILLGSGNADENAVELAKRILGFFNDDLERLSDASIQVLQKNFKGIGEAKAITIAAAMELGVRRKYQGYKDKPLITSSCDAHLLLAPHLTDIQHEEFWLLFLNRANKVIAKEQLSKGGVAGTIVDAKLVFKRALELQASGIILAHNHPSGNLRPSQQDIDITRQLKEGAKLLDMAILDHLIIAENQYYSFADEGLI
jgi:DNA repair protein RadC